MADSNMEMFFFIIDISGYTRYMLANPLEMQHAKLSLSFLIEGLVKRIDLPLEISKLEGDAIFLYLKKSQKDPLWLNQKLFLFFQIFERALHDLRLSTICPCGACQNLDKLTVKIIGHYGNASFERIGRFEELTGIDVILLHRLLKNHVPSQRYLLLTESAYQHMEIPDTVPVTKMQEHYDDVGIINTYVFDPPRVPLEEHSLKSSPIKKMFHSVRMRARDLTTKLGFKHLGKFHNLPF